MIVAETIADCRNALRGKTEIGFVPTMGALHRGHQELLNQCRQSSSVSAASIFVNPLQFGPSEDLSRYPRPLEADLALCEESGVDVVFVPAPQELVKNIECAVTVGRLGKIYEGASRPGHFDGVATIVSKLFHIVEPATAYFGLKDLQQCAVISLLCSSLNFPIELKFAEIVRDHDGLALSSRNTYLSSEERRIAPLLFETLTRCAERIRAEGAESIDHCCANATEELNSNGFNTDYVAAVDSTSFEPPTSLSGARIISAAKLGPVRLIDNVALD